jgi:hypothetical protein
MSNSKAKVIFLSRSLELKTTAIAAMLRKRYGRKKRSSKGKQIEMFESGYYLSKDGQRELGGRRRISKNTLVYYLHLKSALRRYCFLRSKK